MGASSESMTTEQTKALRNPGYEIPADAMQTFLDAEDAPGSALDSPGDNLSDGSYRCELANEWNKKKTYRSDAWHLRFARHAATRNIDEILSAHYGAFALDSKVFTREYCRQKGGAFAPLVADAQEMIDASVSLVALFWSPWRTGQLDADDATTRGPRILDMSKPNPRDMGWISVIGDERSDRFGTKQKHWLWVEGQPAAWFVQSIVSGQPHKNAEILSALAARGADWRPVYGEVLADVIAVVMHRDPAAGLRCWERAQKALARPHNFELEWIAPLPGGAGGGMWRRNLGESGGKVMKGPHPVNVLHNPVPPSSLAVTQIIAGVGGGDWIEFSTEVIGPDNARKIRATFPTAGSRGLSFEVPVPAGRPTFRVYYDGAEGISRAWVDGVKVEPPVTPPPPEDPAPTPSPNPLDKRPWYERMIDGLRWFWWYIGGGR